MTTETWNPELTTAEKIKAVAGHIELLRYLLAELEQGNFDTGEDNWSNGYRLLTEYGGWMGIVAPD